VAHPLHQFAEIRASLGGELVTRVPEIVDLHAYQADSAQRGHPHPPGEVAVTQRRALRTGEDEDRRRVEPERCPMCLAACYWARVARLVFGATSYDVATYGFEDLQLYRELATGADQRSLSEVSAGGSLRAQAADLQRGWAENFPEPVTPKY
jgi:hypothetical protein